jgi:broad specificity phosphatase PhoE
MSELFLVRHAQASFGTDDYDRLSDLGRQQARWLGEHFAFRELEFDRVLCGSMVRHRETVAAVLQGMGREPGEIETDPAWNEFDFEAIVSAYLDEHQEELPAPGASLTAFSRILRAALLAWTEKRLQAALPEPWERFDSRVREGLSGLTRAAGDGQRILLISSGGAISTALRHVLEAPASSMVHMNLQLRNSSVSHLFFNSKNIHFSGFNHVPHLDHPDRAGAVTYY